jgi:methionyl-tRNA formyltransferase
LTAYNYDAKRAAMRVIFMGTPEFAVAPLDALVRLGAEIVGVFCRAPGPGGRRGLELTKAPVHLRAERLGLQVLTPTSLRVPERQAEFVDLNPEAAVVAAYGLILPPQILAAPKLGCVNLHASLLPRWRGAAPIHRAIMAGDTETGIGLMRMEEGLDTGPVAGELRIPIRAHDTSGDLTRRLSSLGGQLLTECWSDFTAGRLMFRPQSKEGVTYARKLNKSETAVDWNGDARSVLCHIHGLSPSPGAHAELLVVGTPERIKFFRVELVEASGPPGMILDERLTVACGAGAIRAVEAQRAGRSAMSGVELMQGGNIKAGERFKLFAAPRRARSGLA